MGAGARFFTIAVFEARLISTSVPRPLPVVDMVQLRVVALSLAHRKCRFLDSLLLDTGRL